MKNRSLTKIALLNLITLGLYETFWYAQTRNEMVAKYHVKIPSAIYLIAIKLLQFIGLVTVVIILFSTLPSNNRAQEKVHAPTKECLAEYGANVDKAAAAANAPALTSVCKDEVDSYFNAPKDHSDGLVLAAVLIPIASLTLQAFFITRWLLPYAKGVGKVTASTWSRAATSGITALAITLPIGLVSPEILIIQNVFNQVK